MLEIERKFLMDGFPTELELLSEVYIEQGYLSFHPEIRIRKAVVRDSGREEYYLTLKGEGDLARQEIETEIPSVFYEDTANYLGKNLVRKDYKKYKLGQWELEVSLVDAGTDWEFYYGEIEFPTEEAAKQLLAKSIFEFSTDFYNDFSYWGTAPNRKKDIPYIFRALILNDTKKIGECIVCQDGEN